MRLSCVILLGRKMSPRNLLPKRYRCWCTKDTFIVLLDWRKGRLRLTKRLSGFRCRERRCWAALVFWRLGRRTCPPATGGEGGRSPGGGTEGEDEDMPVAAFSRWID
jgi:hypothetical protein